MSHATKTPISFVDTSLRDGNQSLWGAVGITTGMAEAALAAMDQIGLRAIDYTSSTNLLMGAKTYGEGPWERISRARAAAPNTPLSAITTGMRFMSWDRASEPVMRMSLRLMARHGLRRLQIAEPMNDVQQVRQIARWAKEEGFESVVAATVFTESPVHTDASYVAAAKEYDADPNIDVVYLKDPGGLLTIERTAALVTVMGEALGTTPLELHSHCTTGEAPLAYLRAAEVGLDAIHTGIGPLANGTAQPQLESTLQNLDAMGIDVDVDRDAVAEASRLLRQIADYQRLKAGHVMPYDLTTHVHQIPGGMMGTLRRQLGELNLAELLPEVVEETSRVRAELGYPIMVTPFSQFVGSQALMNVLATREGQPRYSRIPDEVTRFVLGQYGTPVGEISVEIVDRVASSSRAKELQQVIDPRSLDQLHTDYAAKLGRTLDEEELLLRIVMAPDVLESVLRSTTAPIWEPRQQISSVTGFVDAVTELPNWRHLDVKVGSDRVQLSRGVEVADVN